MAYTTIKKPSDYFNTKLYTGNGSTNAITGVGFQPDLVWGKKRDSAGHSQLYDNVRGVRKIINSSLINAEVTESSGYGLESFDSDGFTLGADPLVASGSINASGGTYASWNWLASNTTASNTDGSITSTVSANTTSGFSIVSYTGTGSAGTVGHGLGSDLKMVIIKNRDSADNWEVYHSSVITSDNQTLNLDNTNALFTRGTASWDISEFSSSVIGLNTNSAVNSSSVNYIAYCFAEKKGFSKFGSYTGNGSSDGTFVYTGFKPSYFLLKSSSNAESWHIYDNQRANAYNPHETYSPTANDSSAEATASSYGIDFVSNGVKLRGSGSGINGSGYTYIYMAFAENPFVTSTGIPTTAR